MRLLEYQENTQTTMVELGELLDLCHCVMGITSELEELEEAIKKNDRVNVMEECCDTLFYFSNYLRFRGIDPVQFESYLELSVPSTIKEVGFTVKNLYNISSKLTDLVKKRIAYSREINVEKEMDLLRMIVVNISIILETYNWQWEECLNNNIEKLKARFGGQIFTENGANNRDLKAERAILEGNQGA